MMKKRIFLCQRISAVLRRSERQARREPVVITKHGRDSLVVISADEWERLKRRDRRVGLTSELPDEWVEAVREAKVSEEFAALDAELKTDPVS
jgi:prevent-host-death family protein